MISQIDLWHFKCFEVLKLPVRPLTMLSGNNASGKSSVMQALALLHQTMREHEWSQRLMLNGATIRLGTVSDVVDQVYGRQVCRIRLFDRDSRWFEWEFGGDRHQMSMAVKKMKVDKYKVWNAGASHPLWRLLPKNISACPLVDQLCRLSYLTAERLGPREHYRYEDPQLTPVVGSRGEYAVSILHSGRDSKVLPSLVDSAAPLTLLRQVEARMSRFFPGCVLAVDQIPRTNAVTLGIRISSDTDFHRPVHAGFGLTQVLPIVVAALSAKKEGMLLIENPEVHLHPAGQAAMGEFLSEVASSGVQVILETHSDHVLNGIRRAVKKGTLPSEDVALHFFSPRHEEEGSRKSQVQSPAIDSNGNIDKWPSGFFDQYDKDMNLFADWI